MSTTNYTDRGKWAEKEVAKVLEKLGAEYATFDWQRLPDARAARGRFPAQIGDYEFFWPAKHGVIEVKSTEHEFRLRRDHVPQLNKLRKRRLAGGRILIPVYHSTLDRWRLVDFDTIAATDGASWDLSEMSLFEKVEDLLRLAVGRS